MEVAKRVRGNDLNDDGESAAVQLCNLKTIIRKNRLYDASRVAGQLY